MNGAKRRNPKFVTLLLALIFSCAVIECCSTSEAETGTTSEAETGTGKCIYNA